MKVAVIGLGMVAETHFRALADLEPDIMLAGIFARDPVKAAAYAEKITPIMGKTPQVYTDLNAIACDDSLDFVILCTPPNARLDIVRTLAAAGKHILMEKPVERDSTAAAQIVGICADAGITLGIVFQHRMRESSRMLATLLAEGTLGPVALAEIAVPWWRDQSYYDEPGRGTYARDGGGVLISQAIHTLDLALSLLGPVTQVQAMACTSTLHKMEAEDFVTAGLTFQSGAIGSLTASTASFPGGAEKITLHCANASVVLASGQLAIHWRDGRTEVRGAAAGTGGGADPMAFTHAWHQAIIADFAQALETGRKPVASGEDALHVHRLIDAIVASSRNARTVYLPEVA